MRRLLLTVASVAGVACGRPPERALPPAAEFLVAAGDSTFWIRADSSGIRLRAAPLRLAQVGGRFVELYVADDDRSFQDAVFVTQRVYARDLLRGDSVVIWRDSVILPLAVAWGRAHPESRLLGPDDEENEHLRRRATLEVSLLGIHDRWASLRVHHDLDDERQLIRHQTERSVVEVATGHAAELAEVMGRGAADSAMRQALLQLRALRDSADRLPADERATARAAARLLGLNERRFSLSVAAGRPGAALFAAANGLTEGDPTFVFPVVTTAEAPWWTPAERARHPDTTVTPEGGAPIERWRRAGYELVAQQDTGDGPVTLVLRDARLREFPVTAVASLVNGVTWLDRPALDSTTRAALQRAFADAAYYSDDVRTAHAGRFARAVSFRSVRYRRPVSVRP